MTENIFDIAIVGGGPIGIFTAFYAAMRNLKTILFESMPTLGGQPNTLYAQKKIYDVAGNFGISGEDLTKNLLIKDQRFNYKTQVATTVQHFTKVDDYYQIETNNGTFAARALVITIGNGPFQPRKLTFAYDHSLEGKQLNYFVQDLQDYKDCDVLVAGGGDTAVDWALEISKIAHQTYLLHRRDQFRALESSVTNLQQSPVQILTPNIITNLELNPQNDKLVVTYKIVGTDQTAQISVDKLLVNYGMTNNSRLLRQWGLQLQGPLISVDSKMQTNLASVYAAGDAVTYTGKQKLITLGFAEGMLAINSAIQQLYPEKSHFGHSSSLFN